LRLFGIPDSNIAAVMLIVEDDTRSCQGLTRL